MKDTPGYLKHKHVVWGPKQVPIKRRVELRSSVDLIAERPSKCNLPRMKILHKFTKDSKDSKLPRSLPSTPINEISCSSKISLTAKSKKSKIPIPGSKSKPKAKPARGLFKSAAYSKPGLLYRIPPNNPPDSESEPVLPSPEPEPEPDTTTFPIEVIEILPITRNPWNTSPIQVFESINDYPDRDSLDLTEKLLPKDSSVGRVKRLTSPFDHLQTLPGYPNQLQFFPGTTPKCELLNEPLDYNYLQSYENLIEKLEQGQFDSLPTPPFKKHILYRHARESLYPVPSHYSSGWLRKIVCTKVDGDEADQFFAQQRKDLALETIKAKQIWEAFREQSIALGNQYYLEWEKRELLFQQEYWDQYKWDLEIQDYFIKLREFDEGIIKNRPKPILLVNDSVTSLLRRQEGVETPPSKYKLDDFDDITKFRSPPVPPLPFVHQQNKPWLWKVRSTRGPTMVPGGYFYAFNDVRETGEVFQVQEFEFANFPQIPNPSLSMWRSPQLTSGVINSRLFFIPMTPSLPSTDHLPIPQREENLSEFMSKYLKWPRELCDTFLAQYDQRDKVRPQLQCQYDSIRTSFLTWNVDNYGQNMDYEYDQKRNLFIKPRKINPYIDFHKRRDWFRFWRTWKVVCQWRYIHEAGMALTQANADAIHFTYEEIMQAWYKWKHPEEVPLPPGKTKIAVLQLNTSGDKEDNIGDVIEMVRVAAQKNAKMLFLPEAFDFIAGSKKDIVKMAESLEGFIIQRYQDLAAQYSVWLSLGGFHERHDNDLKEDGTPWVTNDHILINPDGKIASIYRKIHLFDVDIPEKKIHLKESSYIKAGSKLVVSDMTPIGKIGLGVCYDVRFPEFGMALRSQGAHVLTFPSAFTVHTGKAHWESLLRARAIENQCFVIAAAQCGAHNETRSSYGHSMIIDPWGTVLAEAGSNSEGVIYAEIDLAHLEKVRREMPVISHKIPGIAPMISHPQSSSGSETTTQIAPGDFWIPSGDNDKCIFPFGQFQVKYQTVFLETAHARAFVNRKCVVSGHVLVSCKRKVGRLVELTPPEISDMFLLAQKVEKIMESLHNVDSSTITVQDGKASGQTVEHVHIHVLPRRPCDFEDNDSVYHELATHDKGKNVQWREESEMKQECDAIRAYIRERFSDLL